MSFVLLGHHRTGSSFVLDLIRHNKNVETINEPFSMHLDFFRKDETLWKNKQNHIKYFSDSSETYQYINNLKIWLNEPNYNVVRGFKETALFEKYDWLLENLDITNTIILVRDFRATINSIIKRNMHNSWWNYRERLQVYYGYEVVDLNDIEVCSLIIKERMKYLIGIIKNNEPLLVRLEDYFDNKVLFTENLMNYLNLGIDERQIEFINTTSTETRDSPYSNYRNSKDVVYQWQETFTSKEVEIINGILKEELDFFGYPK